MLSKLIHLFPDFILDPIYDAIFAEFVKRGNIVFEDELTSHNNN